MPHEPGTRLRLSTPNPAQLNQVLPGAEALLAGTRDDGYAQIGLAVEPVEDLAHLKVTREWYAVHLLLAVYRYEQDIVGWVGEEDMLGRWGTR